jgi:hypothetical protein
MDAFKTILLKLFLLLTDILFLAWRSVRQLVLPNTKTKGNILSSIFYLFIGILEKVYHFEHGFLSMAKIFRKKYPRQVFLITIMLLFFLSSSEWTKIAGPATNEKGQQTAQVSIPATEVKKKQNFSAQNHLGLETFYSTNNQGHPHFHCSIKLPCKKFLLICSLRI